MTCTLTQRCSGCSSMRVPLHPSCPQTVSAIGSPPRVRVWVPPTPNSTPCDQSLWQSRMITLKAFMAARLISTRKFSAETLAGREGCVASLQVWLHPGSWARPAAGSFQLGVAAVNACNNGKAGTREQTTGSQAWTLQQQDDRRIEGIPNKLSLRTPPKVDVMPEQQSKTLQDSKPEKTLRALSVFAWKGYTVTPDTPVTPGTSDTPATPDTLLTPGTPVTPAIPDTPVTPVRPDTSITTGTPGNRSHQLHWVQPL